MRDFNRFVGLFWKACLSVTEEANEWLAMMEEMERELDDGIPESQKCCCCKFLKMLLELMMQLW